MAQEAPHGAGGTKRKRESGEDDDPVPRVTHEETAAGRVPEGGEETGRQAAATGGKRKAEAEAPAVKESSRRRTRAEVGGKASAPLAGESPGPRTRRRAAAEAAAEAAARGALEESGAEARGGLPRRTGAQKKRRSLEESGEDEDDEEAVSAEIARGLGRMGELGQEEEDDEEDAPRAQEQEGGEGSEEKVDEEEESSEDDDDEDEDEESNGVPAAGGASEGSLSDDSGGAQAGAGDGAGSEEPQKKIRIFDVVHWALRSLVKMCMFTLIDAVGLWQLGASGASCILATEKVAQAGGQSSSLLQGSDIFNQHSPLTGTRAREGSPEWRIRSKRLKEGVLGYLKVADHITKTALWINRLLRWNHITLRPLRKRVFGGLLVLPGPVYLALDLRSDAGPVAFPLSAGTKQERLEDLQKIAMPVVEGEEEASHPRRELAFIFEARKEGLSFQVQDFQDAAAIGRGIKPFQRLLRMLKIGRDDERFLVKWLALVLRRVCVPALLVQNSILTELLLYAFIPQAAVCNLKQHEAIAASSPPPLSYAAIKCSNISGVLSTTNPLVGLLEDREERQAAFKRGQANAPPPPLVINCAPNHLPALAAGAGVGAARVRVLRSDLDSDEEDKFAAFWEDPANQKKVEAGVVFAAVQGAVFLRQDGGLLLQPSRPPLLSKLGAPSGKVTKPLFKHEKDDFRKVLRAVLDGSEHPDIFAYDPQDDKGGDLGMLCLVACLLSSPDKWRRYLKEREKWQETFHSVVEDVGQRGRPDIKLERMFQSAQRGCNISQRIGALGSCTAYDAAAGPDKRAEKGGGRRVTCIQIVGDSLPAILPQETLDKYQTCEDGECNDDDSAQHLRDLCALKHRLARRKALRENPLAFFNNLKDELKAQHAAEFGGADLPARGEPASQDARVQEKYVKALTEQVLKLRKHARRAARAAAEVAAEAGDEERAEEEAA